MTADDEANFTKDLTALGEIMAEPLSTARLVAYFDALKDLPYESVKSAIIHASRFGRYFPKPTELRAFAAPRLQGADILERLVAILRASPIRLPALEPFDDFIVRALGGQDQVLTMDASLMRYLIDKHAAEWVDGAAVRGIEIPQPGERPRIDESRRVALPAPAVQGKVAMAVARIGRHMPSDTEIANESRAKIREQVTQLRKDTEKAATDAEATREEREAAQREKLRQQAAELLKKK